MGDDDRVVDATAGERLPVGLASAESHALRDDDAGALAGQWRRLGRVATVVAILTAPVLFVWFHNQIGWGIGWSLLATFLCVIVFRGMVDVAVRRFIPWPTLFGQETERSRQDDVVSRRRVWYWRKKLRLAVWIGAIVTIIWVIRLFTQEPGDRSWIDALLTIPEGIGWLFSSGLWVQVLILPFFFIFNFLILFGPLVFMGISQMRSYEPGDADWGVKLDDVRGQAEAKEEVRRVVNLWQSGRGIRAVRRQARARPAPLGCARDWQDDALEGYRDELQRSVRLDARVRLRADLHRDGRGDRAVSRRQGEAARAEVGRTVHRLHRRDRRGGHASPEPRRRSDALSGRPCQLPRPLLLRPQRRVDLDGRPRARDPRVAGAPVPGARPRAGVALPARGRADLELHVSGRDGRDGGVSRPQPAAHRHGRHRRSAVLATVLDEPDQHLPRRLVHRAAPRPGSVATPTAPASPHGADLLRRRLQRPSRGARPGAHQAGSHGPPRLVPHADEAGSPRRLQPLPRQGRPRSGARHRQASRGARADNERLLAGDDRAGLLDGAHDRPLRPARAASTGRTSSTR